MQALGDLQSVRSDVLDRGGPNRSRNQRQVLQPGQPGVQKLPHGLVPIHPGTDLEEPTLVGLAGSPHTRYLHPHDQP